MLWNYNKYTTKPFFAWWRIFNAFLSTCAVAFCTTHEQNNTRKYDTVRFVPVTSLNVVIGLLSLFIRDLIGRTGNKWSVLYMNTKWIYASKTLAYTIRECEIVRNVLHVASTCTFIFWCYRDANIKWTPWVWHASLNSVKVNWAHASAEILSKSHHKN